MDIGQAVDLGQARFFSPLCAALSRNLPVLSKNSLSSHQIGILALILALAGLALLYFWPSGPSYQPVQASSVAIARDGQWVEYSGMVQSVVKKTGGYSLRVCDRLGGCAAAFVADGTDGLAGLDPKAIKGNFTRVWGEAASVKGGGKFVRAHKIEFGG